MDTPLNASSTTAGALFSGSRFVVPQFQREYAWQVTGDGEVEEFWSDLQRSIADDSYFLGLVILTGQGREKDVVDGQQRLLTLTLLVCTIFHQAMAVERRALADRLQSTFLRSINFETDEELPKLTLADATDNQTLLQLLANPAANLTNVPSADDESVSSQLLRAYRYLSNKLDEDLGTDPFKRLGEWADFLTNRLYFAVFLHPDPSSAYKVFEVVNTRGKELTTADLLKSFVLSQTKPEDREERYTEWQAIAADFREDNRSQFVQFIRHSVTVRSGHIPPKDLYDVLAGRGSSRSARVAPGELITLLEESRPMYLQMADPTAEGPATEEQLGIFAALNALGVIAVRPILLAISRTDDDTTGMQDLLKLVVRRIVVGNLGTGNVERRFGQAAQRIQERHTWPQALNELRDLNPPRADFESQLLRRSLNKNVLGLIRHSILQRTTTPIQSGFLHFIRPRQGADWPSFTDDRAAYWGSTIGNTYLSLEDRRPNGTNTWDGVQVKLLTTGIPGEWVDVVSSFADWTEQSVQEVGAELVKVAADVWYA